MRFDVKLTKADIVQGRLFAYFRSGLGVFLAVAGFAFTANSVSMRIRGLTKQPYLPADVLPAILGIFIIPLAVALAGINGQAVKNVLVGILQYDFSNAGFRLSSTKVTAYVEWAEVRRAYESSKYFILTTPGALQILPKRAIDVGSISKLRTLLNEALGKRAKLKRGAMEIPAS